MKRFKNILCVVEPAEINSLALKRACVLAGNNQSNLTVVVVGPAISAGIGLPEGGAISAQLQNEMINRHQQNLARLTEPYRNKLNVTTKVLIGTPFLEIIREVLRGGHDMVIKSPESQDWLDRLLSSNDKHLLRKCPCPVWMVRAPSQDSFQRILAAVDVDDSYPLKELQTREELNDLVMQLASSLALSEFAEMHVAHAWEAVGENAMRHGAFLHRPASEIDEYVNRVRDYNADLLNRFMANTSAKLGRDVAEYIKPQLHLPKGPARKVIPQLAKDLQVDCVVMGTVGRSGIPGLFMGNTAETILDQIECSVLAVKPPGFSTPVQLQD